MHPSTSRGAPRVPFAALAPRAVRLASGVELHRVAGGSGFPLVFVHGAMGDWRTWEPQWGDFTRRFHCISYSRRYSFPNRNELPSPDHSALAEAQDLRLLLDALDVERAIVVGSSYGGFTALALALAQPRRVAALVAVEPPMMKYAAFSAAGRAAAAAFQEQVIAPANAAFGAGDDELAGRIMSGGINGEASSASTPDAMQRRLQNVRAMKVLALSSDEFPLLRPDCLAALSMPVLLVSGQDTPAVHREIFNNVVAAMPQAKSVRIAVAGHSVPRDQPRAFNEAVLNFLTQANVTRRQT